MASRSGNCRFTLQLDFDTRRIKGIHLAVPILSIDEYIPKAKTYEKVPSGTFDAILTSHTVTGEQFKRAIKIKISPAELNIHRINLSSTPQEIIIKPIDKNDRTVLFSEIKIENLDKNYRTVRDWKGLAYQLYPGEYKLRILLPTLHVKTFTLRVTGDTRVYKLQVEEEYLKRRIEPRYRISFPVAYRTLNGAWVPTETINVSTTGVCVVRTQEKVEEGNVYVRLFVPISSVPLECPARICWMKDQGVAPAQMGLELFLTDNMKSSLSNWLSTTASK